MSDEGGRANEDQAAYLSVAWRHTQSYFVDGVVGTASSGGVLRLALGQIIFNPRPDAEHPMLTPVCTLVLTSEGVQNLIAALQDSLEPVEAEDEA